MRENRTHTHTHTHARTHTHTHTRAYTHKLVCFKTLCLTLLFCGEKKITFKCNHFVSGRAVTGSRGTLLLVSLVVSQDPPAGFSQGLMRPIYKKGLLIKVSLASVTPSTLDG